MIVAPIYDEARFSALQRAEIAEISFNFHVDVCPPQVSVLFNEPKLLKLDIGITMTELLFSFSALQRAEIAEICERRTFNFARPYVSVLFNEPKLLKLQ